MGLPRSRLFKNVCFVPVADIGDPFPEMIDLRFTNR